MNSRIEVPIGLVDPALDVQLSIAISLKRIADKLEISQKQPVIMDAAEALKFYAAIATIVISLGLWFLIFKWLGVI